MRMRTGTVLPEIVAGPLVSWIVGGLEGAVVGMDCFGESAPAGELFKHFGFTVDNVVATVKKVLG